MFDWFKHGLCIECMKYILLEKIALNCYISSAMCFKEHYIPKRIFYIPKKYI